MGAGSLLDDRRPVRNGTSSYSATASELAYECYIDIGCANGLYVVGLAHINRVATVYAYDIDPAARAATERNATLNGVAARVRIGAEADQAGLAAIIGSHGSTLAISDIEGGELDLVDPVACPALLGADWLIELHGDIPAAIAEFSRRFGGPMRCTSSAVRCRRHSPTTASALPRRTRHGSRCPKAEGSRRKTGCSSCAMPGYPIMRTSWTARTG